MSTNKIIEILGDQSDFLLNHTCKTIDKSLLHIPSPNTIDEIWMSSDRNTRTLNSLQIILGHGRLANTGYPWIKELNTRQERLSPRILSILIREIS